MRGGDAASCPQGAVSVWRATLSGMCASLVGVGLGRFAYSALIPLVIAAHWFTASEAAYLGAANLAGYLVGALGARWMTRVARPIFVLRAMMVVATAAFFACADPWSFLWFFVWRFAAGVAGGVLMVLAASTVLPHVPPARRGLASGAIFTGVGLGIAASGTLVPLLLDRGLVATWCSLGALALVLTALAWGGWPDRPATAAATPTAADAGAPRSARILRALYPEYALNAVGLVPHMVFLVDFVARALGRGLHIGVLCWIVFGAGALGGPVAAGYVGDRIGFRAALRFGFILQAAAVVLLVVTTATPALIISSLIVGAFVPGIVPMILGRIHEMIPEGGDAQRAAWSTATTAFALGQAVAAYGFSGLFASTGSYTPLFALGATALLLAFGIDLATGLFPDIAPVHAPAASRRR
jgi:predicted MFS family arabinose efflux permease